MKPNPNSRIERKKEETRKKIISVAMDLFNRQGFDQTTVEQIAEVADVAKGTVFNYFPVKEAIVNEYIQRAIKEGWPEGMALIQGLPDTHARLTASLRYSIEWLEENLKEDLLKVYLLYRMQTGFDAMKNQTLRSGFGGVLAQIIRLGQEAEEIRRDIYAEELSDHLSWLSVFLMIIRLSSPERPSVDKLVEREVDLFLNGAREKIDKEN